MRFVKARKVVYEGIWVLTIRETTEETWEMNKCERNPLREIGMKCLKSVGCAMFRNVGEKRGD